jgi:carotenoid cleavage dioxygenase
LVHAGRPAVRCLRRHAAGSYTAHPHLDPLTGENHAICYSAHNPGEVRHVVVDAHGKVTRELAIPVEHPMIHDCAITARYVVILDLPVTFSLPAAMAGKPFPYRWNPQHRARVGLLPRTGAASDVIWCDVEPCSVFHVANAYDRADGAVIMDVCAYGTMFGPEAVGPDGAARGLERWTIDPVTGTVAIATIDATPQEFPRPDERRFGQPYRYAYAMAVPTDPAAEFIGDTRLFRHDLVEGTRQVHDFGPRRHPGEFVFVPASKTRRRAKAGLWASSSTWRKTPPTSWCWTRCASRTRRSAWSTCRIACRQASGNWVRADITAHGRSIVRKRQQDRGSQ